MTSKKVKMKTTSKNEDDLKVKTTSKMKKTLKIRQHQNESPK